MSTVFFCQRCREQFMVAPILEGLTVLNPPPSPDNGWTATGPVTNLIPLGWKETLPLGVLVTQE